MREPAALREIERLQEIAKHESDLVRKTYSIVDVFERISTKVFHEDDPEFHRLPETRDLVAQYLLLYEMSGGTSAQEFVSHDYQSASLELRLKLGPVSETATLVADLDDYLTENPPQHATVTLTGIGAPLAHTHELHRLQPNRRIPHRVPRHRRDFGRSDAIASPWADLDDSKPLAGSSHVGSAGLVRSESRLRQDHDRRRRHRHRGR